MRKLSCAAVLVLVTGFAAAASAQTPPASQPPAPASPRPAAPAGQPPALGQSVTLPSEFQIGPDDVLGIVFWRDTEMTGDVTVRPDGMITLPLIGDLKAAGLQPDQLRQQIQQAASKYISDPVVSVVVRQIHSRKVYITGQVTRPGSYPLTGAMTVLQLIAIAGGLSEFADEKGITITRVENGQTKNFKFNYKDVARGKKLEQNLVLKPADTVVVP